MYRGTSVNKRHNLIFHIMLFRFIPLKKLLFCFPSFQILNFSHLSNIFFHIIKWNKKVLFWWLCSARRMKKKLNNNFMFRENRERWKEEKSFSIFLLFALLIYRPVYSSDWKISLEDAHVVWEREMRKRERERWGEMRKNGLNLNFFERLQNPKWWILAHLILYSFFLNSKITLEIMYSCCFLILKVFPLAYVKQSYADCIHVQEVETMKVKRG